MSDLHPLLAAGEPGVGALERLLIRARMVPDFGPSLVAEVRRCDEETMARATWLLLRFVRQGGVLPEQDWVRLARCAPELLRWECRLHVCQLFSIVRCPEQVEETLFEFLADCAKDQRGIIRAWALSALVPYRKNAEFRRYVSDAFLLARNDSSKAVQARLRQLAQAERRKVRSRPAARGA